MKTPLIFTITGPSCSGKTTLEAELMKTGMFGRVISHTTRPMRDGEVNGVNYYFVTKEQFMKDMQDGKLIEHVWFNGHMYGAAVSEIERLTLLNKPILIVCEPHGREQIVSYGKKNGYRVITSHVYAPTDLIARRFLARFAKEIEAGKTGSISVYADRLVTMMKEEVKWTPSEYPYINNLIMTGETDTDRNVKLIVAQAEAYIDAPFVSH